MITYNQKLGNTIRNYRKSKDISTQELAKRLNVSVGCINHIENAKNNVFKLDLLLNIIKELDIPFNEILLDNSLTLDDISLNSKEQKLEIVFKEISTINTDLLMKHLSIIINSYLETALECNFNPKTIETISNHMVDELNYSKNLISFCVYL